MNFKSYILIALVLCIVIISCTANKTKTDTPMTTTNILLKEWVGPYGGVPAFDKMKVEDLKEAILTGMEINLMEIEEIANNQAEPTFENTLVVMEKAGKELDRAFTYYGIMSSNASSTKFREIQKELSPKISDFQSKISQNKKLFQRIKTIYEQAKTKPLEAAEQRVLELKYTQFVMNGALLDESKKERYAAIDKELSKLYTQC